MFLYYFFLLKIIYTMKKESLITRAGVIAYVEKGESTNKFILITSRKDGKLVMPKGKIENGENMQEAALREALEEAGIKGRIRGELECTDDVQWYLMKIDEVLENYKEVNLRNRYFMTYDEAIKHVNLGEKARKVLKMLPKNLCSKKED